MVKQHYLRVNSKHVVRNAIVKFDDDNLSNFDAIFRHSNLVKTIDESEDSILSNTTNIRLARKHTVTPNFKEGFKVNFGNALYNPHSGHNADSGGITNHNRFLCRRKHYRHSILR